MRLLLSALLVTVAVFAAGCSSARYNPTAYDYYIDQEALAAKPIKKVVLASVNVSGEPTRSMLRDSVAKIDAEVTDYLQKNGYVIAPAHLFNNAWQQALLTFGDFYDPTSGRVDQQGWQQVMAATMSALRPAASFNPAGAPSPNKRSATPQCPFLTAALKGGVPFKLHAAGAAPLLSNI